LMFAGVGRTRSPRGTTSDCSSPQGSGAGCPHSRGRGRSAVAQAPRLMTWRTVAQHAGSAVFASA
jgi:hypothetical protein